MSGLISNQMQNTLDMAKLNADFSKLKNIENDAKSAQKAKLKEAAQQFESVFVHQLLKVMDKTVERSGLVGGGQAESIFRDMFYQEIAKNISTSEGANFGMARQIYDQMSRYI